MKKGLKIYLAATSTLCLILLAVCTALLTKDAAPPAVEPDPDYGQLSERLESVEEKLSDCIDELDSCGAKLAYQKEPPMVNIAEAVVVHEEEDGWYCCISREDRQILAALSKAQVFDADIKTGDKLFVAYETIALSGPASQDAYPMPFTKVFRVDPMGEATEDEFKKALEYYDSKDWLEWV